MSRAKGTEKADITAAIAERSTERTAWIISLIRQDKLDTISKAQKSEGGARAEEFGRHYLTTSCMFCVLLKGFMQGLQKGGKKVMAGGA